MARDFYDEIIHILRRAGWTKATGGKGSHEKWINAGGKRVVIVPRSKSRHTAKSRLGCRKRSDYVVSPRTPGH